MTVTVASFTQEYPNFATTSEPMIVLWINRAYAMLDATAWADQLDFGVGLFVAHNLTFFANAANANGAFAGIASSKSVGGVSVSYDLSKMMNPDAGSYNATSYGMMFYQLAMMIGAGGVQLMPCSSGESGEPTGVLWQTD